MHEVRPQDAETEMVPIEVPPGGAAFHHGLCFHGSPPNERPDAERRAIISHMVSTETTWHPTTATRSTRATCGRASSSWTRPTSRSCGARTATAPPSSRATSPRRRDVKSGRAGALTLCCSDMAAPPLFWTEADGERRGYEPAAAQAVAEALGLELRWVFRQWADFARTLAARECDGIWCGSAITPRRERCVPLHAALRRLRRGGRRARG